MAGFVGLGKALSFNLDINLFEHFLHPVVPALEVEHAPPFAGEWALIGISVAVAVSGILLARRFYWGPEAFRRPKALAERFPALYSTVANKYYVDEIYGATVVAGPQPGEGLVRVRRPGRGRCGQRDAPPHGGDVVPLGTVRPQRRGRARQSGGWCLRVGEPGLAACAVGRGAGVRAGHGCGLCADGRGGAVARAAEGDAMGLVTNLLIIICYVPLVGSLAILFLLREEEQGDQGGRDRRGRPGLRALAAPLVPLRPGGPAFQFGYEHEWIPSLGAKYHFGVDGISMLLILLTTLLGFISVYSSFSAITEREKEYYVFLLLLQTGMLGVFCRSTSSCSTCSGRSCSSRCTSSSGSGAGRASSTRRSSSSCTRWSARC